VTSRLLLFIVRTVCELDKVKSLNVFFFNSGLNITSLGEFQFDIEPRDYTAVKDSGAAFDCTVRSTSDVDIDWLKDGAPVAYDSRRYFFALICFTRFVFGNPIYSGVFSLNHF